jgi:hypothetical protein
MAKTGKQYTKIGLANASDFPIVVRNIKEASTNTFLRGCPVFFSGGYIDQVAAGPTAIFGFSNEAGHSSAADGTEVCQVLKALPGIEFSGTIDTTSLTETMRGSVFALVESSSTWVLATSSASSDCPAMVVGWDSTWEAGDDYPVVNFVLIPEFIQYNLV